MVLNNGTADGEPHAHAAGLCGEKGLKDARHRVRVETCPGIFYLYLYLVPFNV
jgi:hypothetical protein